MIRRSFAALVALSLGLLAGCSPTAPATTSPSLAAATGAATRYPLTIQTFDFAHNKVDVTIPKAPEKVVVDGLNNIEILLKLGLGDRIVLAAGAEVLPELKADYAKLATAASLAKEPALAAQPDFILGWYGVFQEKMLGDVPFWHGRNIATYMSLNSYAQGPSVPTAIKYEYEDILNIGKIFDKQVEATELVNEMKAAVANAKTNAASGLKIAVLEDYDGKLSVYGAKSLAGSIAETAGASMALGNEADQFTRSASAEQLIAANPDRIFMVYYGEDVAAAEKKAVEVITKNPAYASLKAVQTNKVYAVALSSVYCSGLRTLDGINRISAGLKA